MPLDYSIIGLRIKHTRIEKKITQLQIAEKLGVTLAYVGRIERGDCHLSLTRLSEICDFLDVAPGEIINGTSNTSSGYLSDEFEAVLKKCSPEKQRMILEVAKVIAKRTYKEI